VKVDEIHRSVLLEARSKKGKPRTGAFRIARTQTDTSTFECVLLDYLGHQDLQFHAEEYGTLGWSVIRIRRRRDIAVVLGDAVHPDVFGHGFSANNEVATIQNIDPREGTVMREFVGKAAIVTGGAIGAAAQATFSAFGKVHILCNNAGVGARGCIRHSVLGHASSPLEIRDVANRS
jgi:hypothetical protein